MHRVRGLICRYAVRYTMISIRPSTQLSLFSDKPTRGWPVARFLFTRRTRLGNSSANDYAVALFEINGGAPAPDNALRATRVVAGGDGRDRMARSSVRRKRPNLSETGGYILLLVNISTRPLIVRVQGVIFTRPRARPFLTTLVARAQLLHRHAVSLLRQISGAFASRVPLRQLLFCQRANTAKYCSRE